MRLVSGVGLKGCGQGTSGGAKRLRWLDADLLNSSAMLSLAVGCGGDALEGGGQVEWWGNGGERGVLVFF